MEDVLVIAHIAAAILFIGPVAIATAMLPRLATRADQAAASMTLHRVSRTYGVLSLLVPALGVILAINDDLLDTAWVGASILLSLVAGVILWLVIRDQSHAVAAGVVPRRLPVMSGLFSLLWLAILALMVVRPG